MTSGQTRHNTSSKDLKEGGGGTPCINPCESRCLVAKELELQVRHLIGAPSNLALQSFIFAHQSQNSFYELISREAQEVDRGVTILAWHRHRSSLMNDLTLVSVFACEFLVTKSFLYFSFKFPFLFVEQERKKETYGLLGS